MRERKPGKRGKDKASVVKQGEIEVKLTCPFCDKGFTRVSWFKKHGSECSAREKFERRFGKQRFLPKVAQLRVYTFAYEGFFISYLTESAFPHEVVVTDENDEPFTKIEYRERPRAEVEQEFLAEADAIVGRGRRPAAVLTSSRVVDEMAEAGYLRDSG